MIIKFIYYLCIILILSPNFSHAKSKYFFGFGYSQMNLNGTGSYSSTFYKQVPFDPSGEYFGELTNQSIDVNLSESLHWKNNLHSLISFSGGYRISYTNTLVVNFALTIPKKGYITSSSSGNILWKNPSGTSLSSKVNSNFQFLQFSIHDEYSLSKSIFLQAGLNFNSFSTDVTENSYSYNNKLLSGKAFGITTGIGYSKEIIENRVVLFKVQHTFNYHHKSNIGKNGMDIFFNGISLGIEFRHFLD